MTSSEFRAGRCFALLVACFSLLLSGTTWSQAAAPQNTQAPPAAAEQPKDTLGRATPRGTVLGFLSAIRKDNPEVAALYLNTPLRGEDAQVLARQLGAVLNRRLPARLNQISDKPEGSVPDPLKPDKDVIGKIETAEGDLEIAVELVDRGKMGKVWLFSSNTLDSIPRVFQELSTPAIEEYLPEFMVNTRIAGVAIFEWLALLLGVPVLYLLTGLINRAAEWMVGEAIRRLKHNPSLKGPRFMQVPLRLLLVSVATYILARHLALPLLARQFWHTAALIITIVACLWWLLLFTRSAERYFLQRRPNLSGSASVLRLARRMIDGLLLFAGLLFVLYHFGIQLTAALAGLGVGGIAVALAAQKTLENVIGGISLIADQAVRVGDFLNLGDVQGTVEDVGLRSTRIRTLDRTLVTVPNGQIAGMRLETLSARDKFWFHPIFALRYETSPAQLRSVLNNVREYLGEQRDMEPASIRVRFIRVSNFSFEVEIFAYVNAIDWSDFLNVQERLLFGVLDIVQKAGTALAFPSQTLYFTDDMAKKQSRQPADARAASAKNLA